MHGDCGRCGNLSNEITAYHILGENQFKNILDGNWWADKIGEKSGAYEKARNSKMEDLGRQFDRLEMVGMANRWMRFIFVVLELLINQIGLTMLDGDKMIRLYAIIFIVALLGGAACKRYYYDTTATIAQLRENNAKLEVANEENKRLSRRWTKTIKG